MKWDWHGVVALILATGIAISVVLLAVSELDHGTAGHISGEESTLLSTVLGAGIGAIATYVGLRSHDGPPGPPDGS